MEALKKKKELEDQKRKAQVQNFLHRGKTNRQNLDNHQKISIADIPSTVNNNASQKIIEKQNNEIRKSSGFFNNWGNKGDKSDKNKLT